MEHKQAIYEQRLDESEVEINSLRCQLTELMAVYDDLQVDMHKTHTINIKYCKNSIDKENQSTFVFYLIDTG